MPRAFLRVGGSSVARQQLAVASALRCERVICLAPVPSPELAELQGLTERTGARFHQIANLRGLAGLVTAADEVFVFADGLFASTTEVMALLDQGNAVLVQPIDQGLAAGFERIDLQYAAGGAMRIPGRLVERLTELPFDCDAASALLRIALQAGVPQRSIPELGANGRFWTLVRSEAEAHALEPQWIRQRTRASEPPNFTRMLALKGVRAFGAALLHGGVGPVTVGVSAGALVLMGLGAGWFGHGVLALIFCAIAALLQAIWALLARIDGNGENNDASPWQVDIFGWSLDFALVLLVVWNDTSQPSAPFYARLFAPLVLIGLLRLVPRTLGARWTAWLQDRAILAAGLAASISAGTLHTAVYAAGILLLIVGISLPVAESRLTRP